GRNGGDEVRASLQINTSTDPSPTSPTDGGGHKRTPSGQTRFQELVHGPVVSSSHHSRPNSKHRRSASGRTSAEVERQLDISPLDNRRVSGSSGSSAAVGRVVSWVRAFGHGQHVHPHGQQQQQNEKPEEGSEYSGTSARWTTDGLAEWCYARSQAAPTVATLVPRAGIAAAALFSFWAPQTSGRGGTEMRDGAFFRSNGTLTGFARGVLLANVAWVLARALVVLFSFIGLWILSGQMCAGMCGPRYRWEEPLDEGEWDGEKDDVDVRDKLNWEWRIAARQRVQDAYELCMVRRRSTTAHWRAPPPPSSQPPTPGPTALIEGKGKGRETPRPTMDTFGSTLGAAIVKERNSDQELALSGLDERERGVPVVEITEHEPRRGILTADMFTAPPAIPSATATVAPGFIPLVPPITAPTTPSSLPFPLQPTNFSIGDYAHSQESVRIRAPAAAGSEADTSGSYSEGHEVDTSASLSSLGQPISSRFFPITRPGDRSSGSAGQHGSGSGSGGGGMSHLESPVSSNNRSSGQGTGRGSGGGRGQGSLLSHDDSILSHNRDSIISHLPRTPTSTLSRAARDSIISRVQDDSIVSSPSQSVRSGLIPPPPPNPNRRRRMTAPSAASSSVDSFGVIRPRVGSHPFTPVEFGPPTSSDVEGFEAEQEDSVGMLSTTSSRKNSLAAVSQRGARRGRVSSGSQSGSQSGSGSARSRAVSANYSVSVSGSGSGSGGSVRRRSRSVHGEDEDRDYTLGHRPLWRRESAQLEPGMEETEGVSPVSPQSDAPVAGPSRQPANDPEPEQR
ncbi:hypothetical protein FRC07_004792, partial [Ceratobasidium sp. 392]